MAARSIWSGSITFGLVNIPVRLQSAVRSHDISFHLLSEDGSCRLRRKLYCPETGKEFDFSQTARGVEIAPDQYVIVDEEELERVRPESGHTIDISDFVELGDIDPVYFEKSYIVVPGDHGERSYRLLYEAMERAGRVGVARFVMRRREYLAALRPRDGVLELETMHYHDELVPVPKLETSKSELKDREVDLALALIESMTRPFEPSAYKDDYRERLQEIIDAHAAGKEITVAAPQDGPAPVLDLMEALRRSLGNKTAAAEGGSSGSSSEKKKASKASSKSKSASKKSEAKSETKSRRSKTG